MCNRACSMYIVQHPISQMTSLAIYYTLCNEWLSLMVIIYISRPVFQFPSPLLCWPWMLATPPPPGGSLGTKSTPKQQHHWWPQVFSLSFCALHSGNLGAPVSHNALKLKARLLPPFLIQHIHTHSYTPPPPAHTHAMNPPFPPPPLPR